MAYLKQGQIKQDNNKVVPPAAIHHMNKDTKEEDAVTLKRRENMEEQPVEQRSTKVVVLELELELEIVTIEHQMYHMTLGFDPNIAVKNKPVKEIVHGTYTRIYHKTDYKAIFFTTAGIKPPPKPIINIKQAFQTTVAELKDFFQLAQIRSGKQVKIHLAFIIPGMTEPIIHRFMMNMLQAGNLWLDSEVILASRHVDIGWVENSNLGYTSFKDIETIIEKAIAKVAKNNSTAVVQFALIKEEKFIECILNQFYGAKVTGDGRKIQTTNNYYKPALNLLGIIPSTVLSQYYNVISKETKQALRLKTYDKLITRN